MFLPEAQVLVDESSAPSQFPKMKYADAKLETGASSAKKAPPSSSSSSSFNGFKAKGIPAAGLKTTGLPPRESFEQLTSNDNYNDETNSFTSEPMFRDEASTTGMSLPPSTPEAAPSRATATTAEYHDTMTTAAESEFDYETVVTNDGMSEYEEQTIMSEYEEQTVNTGYMTEIQEELEDVISTYDQTSGVRPLD
jgi:hypothetical protein